MKYRISGGFGWGVAAAFCWMGFIQDWLGLEGYIRHVVDQWVDLHWGWLLAATVLCIVGDIMTERGSREL